MYPLNTRVRILRGGLDDFPQVKLAGVPGRICSTHANAAPGMLSVWVDWEQTQYKDVEGLPRVINNFPADLEQIKEPQPAPRSLTPVAPLSAVRPKAALKDTSSDLESEPDSDPDESPSSGGLRLV